MKIIMNKQIIGDRTLILNCDYNIIICVVIHTIEYVITYIRVYYKRGMCRNYAGCISVV